jgi:hypothetical protein
MEDIMTEIRVNGLRGVELSVFNLKDTADFYANAWGLSEVAAANGAAYLRAAGNEHHGAVAEGAQAGLLRARKVRARVVEHDDCAGMRFKNSINVAGIVGALDSRAVPRSGHGGRGRVVVGVGDGQGRVG